MTNGDHVRVDGVVETEHHQGRYTFYNEVQATKVICVSAIFPQHRRHHGDPAIERLSKLVNEPDR